MWTFAASTLGKGHDLHQRRHLAVPSPLPEMGRLWRDGWAACRSWERREDRAGAAPDVLT
jgi:hypothetical protein